MLNEKQIEKLKFNWGEKADALSCRAEACFISEDCQWKCYLYAMNPEYEDEVLCIVNVSKYQKATVEKWNLQNIKGLYDCNGEGVKIDQEFMPIMVDVLLKNLNRNHIYER